MPAPYDYTIQRPDIMGAIGAYEAGQDRRRAMDTQKKQDMFAQYLPGALKGDQAAIDQASQFATPDQQIQLSKIGPEKIQQTLQYQQAIAEILGDVDNSDTQGFEAAKQRAVAMGLPQDQVSKLTIADLPRLRKQSGAIMKELEIEAKRLGLDVARANIRQSDAAAAASRAAAARAGSPNVDPNTGKRVPPAGIQGRDYAAVDKFATSADAAANIATTLRGVEDKLGHGMTGPSFGAQRTAAGVMSYVPGYQWLAKNLTGEDRIADTINTYDAIEQASKTIGIDTLQKVGGSDTERELLTAIQTTVNPDVSPAENKRRFRQQLAAADILAKKSQLASEWVNRFGSLQYAAPDGTTWQKFWPEYQKQEWGNFMKNERSVGGGASTSRKSVDGFTVTKVK